MRKTILILLILFISSIAHAGKTTASLPNPVLTVASSTSANKNAADYVCDGTADQTEINAAIAALPAGGGTVMLMEGNFNVSNSIDFLGKDYVAVVGQGAGITKITAANMTVAVFYDNTATVLDTIDNITIRDIEINREADTKDENTSRKGIFMRYMKNARIENMYIHGSGGTCIGIDFLQDVYVVNNTLIECGTSTAATGSSGIGIGTGKFSYESTVIANNSISQSGLAGVLIEAQSGAIDSALFNIQGNNIFDGFQYGVYIRGASYINVTDNNIIDNDVNGIFIDDYQSITTHDIVVSDNNITGSGAYGVRIADTSGADLMLFGNNLCTNTSGALTETVSSASELFYFGNYCQDDNLLFGTLATDNSITSTGTGSLGWSVVDGTDNTACTAQCTNAAVFGFNGTSPVGPADTTADLCVCAGSN